MAGTEGAGGDDDGGAGVVGDSVAWVWTLWRGRREEPLLLEAVTAHEELHGRLPSRPESTTVVAGTLPHVSAGQVRIREPKREERRRPA